MLLGIDLTASEQKPSACALLDSAGALEWLGFLDTDLDILAFAAERRPAVVAIDAPLSLPTGMDCLEAECPCRSVWPWKGRQVERKLIAEGIGLYITTKKSFIKPMIYRGISLAQRLRRQGHKVIEVYPYASKVRLFGKPIPKKTTKEGLDFLKERLTELVPGLAQRDGHLGHDLYDAVVAAYTAHLHSDGETDNLGLENEGQIVVPLERIATRC